MNLEIGEYVREEGFRGVFPWAANYDALGNSNELIPYLAKGLGILPTLSATTTELTSTEIASTSAKELANNNNSYELLIEPEVVTEDIRDMTSYLRQA